MTRFKVIAICSFALILLAFLLALFLFTIASDLQGSNPILGLAGLVVIIGFGVFFSRGDHKYMQTYVIESRKKVNEYFLKIGIDEKEQQYALKGSTAIVVRDEESDGSQDGITPEYHLTRFVRNPDGEYFMLMFSVIGGEISNPFVKHVVQTNARIALKEKSD
jgi:hypothetical protein